LFHDRDGKKEVGRVYERKMQQRNDRVESRVGRESEKRRSVIIKHDRQGKATEWFLGTQAAAETWWAVTLGTRDNRWICRARLTLIQSLCMT